MTMTMERYSELVAYVNGSATREEARQVERLIAADPETAAECRALGVLRQAVKIVHGDTPQLFGLERLQRDIGRIVRQQARVRCLRSVAAVAASIVVALCAVTFVPGAQDNDLFRALGGATVHAQLQARFTATATQPAIQDCLREVGAEIVAGPSAVGAYRLRLPAGADVAAALATLRAHADIVEFVEREP